MIRRNTFFLLIFFFITFTSYNFSEQKNNASFIFPIKKIIVENTFIVDSIKLNKKLEFLKNSSLFFLDEKSITSVVDKFDFISSIQLKKKYPYTLKILVSEDIPVATKIDGKKKYYLTKEGKKINSVEKKAFKDIPTIFGDYKNFSSFFYELEKSNFKINTVKAFYYFDIGRWDIVLKDKRIIKLPVNNYQKILIKIDSILDEYSFSKYKIFDYRINDRLVLK